MRPTVASGPNSRAFSRPAAPIRERSSPVPGRARQRLHERLDVAGRVQQALASILPMYSPGPPASATTTGRPAAMPSTTTVPSGSGKDRRVHEQGRAAGTRPGRRTRSRKGARERLEETCWPFHGVSRPTMPTRSTESRTAQGRAGIGTGSGMTARRSPGRKRPPTVASVEPEGTTSALGSVRAIVRIGPTAGRGR